MSEYFILEYYKDYKWKRLSEHFKSYSAVLLHIYKLGIWHGKNDLSVENFRIIRITVIEQEIEGI